MGAVLGVLNSLIGFITDGVNKNYTGYGFKEASIRAKYQRIVIIILLFALALSVYLNIRFIDTLFDYKDAIAVYHRMIVDMCEKSHNGQCIYELAEKNNLLKL